MAFKIQILEMQYHQLRKYKKNIPIRIGDMRML